MNKLVFVATAWNWYQHYLPLYALSIHHAYPEATCSMFLIDKDDILVDNLNYLINKIPSIKIDITDITAHSDDQFERYSERWLIDSSYFEHFDYAYVGDVDVLVVNEQPTLLQTKLNRLKQFNLPYANTMREPPYDDCMSACHFFEIKPYFEKMIPIIKRHANNRKLVNHPPELDPAMNNERELYHMVKQVYEVIQPKELEYAHIPGAHLGTCRINEKLYDGWQPYIYKQLVKYANDPLFQELANRSQTQQIINGFNQFKETFKE